MEIWKPIQKFENFYEISNIGNVRRIARGKLFNAEQIKRAKQMFAEGAKLREVAVFLNTSNATASAIKNGKTWSGDETYRPVKVVPDTKFYAQVCLCVNGIYHRYRVHRLMWETFIGPILGRLEVNHKNLDRMDNRLENLELLTHRENIQHAQDIYKKERAHLPKGLRRGPKSVYAKIKHT